MRIDVAHGDVNRCRDAYRFTSHYFSNSWIRNDIFENEDNTIIRACMCVYEGNDDAFPSDVDWEISLSVPPGH